MGILTPHCMIEVCSVLKRRMRSFGRHGVKHWEIGGTDIMGTDRGGGGLELGGQFGGADGAPEARELT